MKTAVYPAISNSFYRLSIILKPTRYKSVSVKIFDNKNKLVFPLIDLPDILFTDSNIEIKKIEDLDKLTSFKIYFKSTNTSSLNIKLFNCDDKDASVKLERTSKQRFYSGVNLWKMRKLMDFKYVNYYLDNVYTDFSKSFTDRLKAYYILLNGVYCINNFVYTLRLKLPRRAIKQDDTVKVLYLMCMSPQYESLGYTVRTHSLLKYANRDPKYEITASTRLGYPFEKFPNKDLKNVYKSFVLDKVIYIKMLDHKRTINSYNIIEYLKKYIMSTIIVARKLNVDIIHAATDYTNGLAAYYAAKFLNLKSVYEVRGFWEESSVAFKPEVHMSDMVRLRERLESFVCGNVDRVLAINEGLAEEIHKRSLKEAAIVPNGVDLELVKFSSDIRDELREKHSIGDSFVIGYFGSMLVYEGLDLAIDCASRCVEKGLDIKLVFAGGGMELNNLLEQAKKLGDRFIYLGKLNNTETIKYYNIVDTIVYPRLDLEVCRSTISSKVFEAMGMGRCVVCSRLPAYKEVIEDMVTGVYCEPGSLEDLVEKVELVIGDDDLREKIGAAARERVEERGWDRVAEKLIGVYGSMV